MSGREREVQIGEDKSIGTAIEPFSLRRELTAFGRGPDHGKPDLMEQGGAAVRPDAGARPSEGDETRLIDRIAGGDLRAFEQLYRLYGPRLTRFIR